MRQKELGDGLCNGGYSKSSKTCWENDSSEWGKVTLIRKMDRKCSWKGYNSRTIALGGGCYNYNYHSGTKGFSYGWTGPYCSSSYAAPWYLIGCTNYCRSGTSMSLGFCYDNSCHSGYDKTSTKICTPHRRDQNSHTAKCDAYCTVFLLINTQVSQLPGGMLARLLPWTYGSFRSLLCSNINHTKH